MTIWLDAVGGSNQQGGQAQGKQDVAGNVKMLVLADRGGLMQRQVRPNGASNGKRHTDQENIPPVDRSQDSPRQKADESAGRPGDHVDSHRQPALVGWKGIGQDGSGIGHQEGTSHSLDEAEDDDLQGRTVPRTVHRVEQDRAYCKYGESQVVHANPAKHIRNTAKRDQ